MSQLEPVNSPPDGSESSAESMKAVRTEARSHEDGLIAPAASPSLLGRLAAKRIAFFSRHEAFFLWVLSPPIAIIGVLLLVYLMMWVSGKGSMMEMFFRSGQWNPR